jgi:HD superfamily phosphohydrolase
VDESGEKLAITYKGKTAAELLVFARYVMFSEVYWHHAVRSATAMFQRGFYRWYQSKAKQSDLEFAESIAGVFQLSETDLVRYLMTEYPSACQARLIDSLFGRERKLYKRIASYSCLDGEAIYKNVAQRPYAWLVELSQRLAIKLEKWLGRSIDPDFVLIDAPPIGLEVQFQVQVHFPNEGRFVSLETVSPVVQTLAIRQFDDFVKQVRIFVDPSLIAQIKTLENFRFRLDAFLNRSVNEV